MNNILSMLRSSVGLKFIMALTGLCMIGFVAAHLLGNLQIFLGEDGEIINHYAQLLKGMPLLLWSARLGLLVVVTLHVTIALILRRLDLAARPKPYAMQTVVQATLPSRTMLLTGVVLLVYIILHLSHFTFGWVSVDQMDHEKLNVYAMIAKSFQQPVLALLYIIAMGFLGFHLSHAIPSLLKSLGVNHPRFNTLIQNATLALAVLISLAYVSIPVAVLARLLRAPITTAGL